MRRWLLDQFWAIVRGLIAHQVIVWITAASGVTGLVVVVLSIVQLVPLAPRLLGSLLP